MRYVIQTAISHGRIKQQITTVGSHGCIINNCDNDIYDYVWLNMSADYMYQGVSRIIAYL